MCFTYLSFSKALKSFFYMKIKNLQILHLHSIVKKDFRSPSLHYGWHSQLKLIFSKENKDQNYKTKTHDMTEYRRTEPRQIAGQGKEKKIMFFPFLPSFLFEILGLVIGEGWNFFQNWLFGGVY